MPWHGTYPDDDTNPVIVPRSERKLVPVAADRKRLLLDHLATLLGRMRPNEAASVVQPGPEGFAARVATMACTMCRGWCCRNGHEDGFLDEATLARCRPSMTAEDIIALYVGLVPETGYEGSCIFHGPKGCTLPRERRSNVCNTYFCGELGAFIQAQAPPAPTVVIAGELRNMRVSPVIRP